MFRRRLLPRLRYSPPYRNDKTYIVQFMQSRSSWDRENDKREEDYFKNLRHTGVGTSAIFPVSLSIPVSWSILKVTIVFES